MKSEAEKALVVINNYVQEMIECDEEIDPEQILIFIPDYIKSY